MSQASMKIENTNIAGALILGEALSFSSNQIPVSLYVNGVRSLKCYRNERQTSGAPVH